MTASKANAEEILKEDYKPVIREQLNNKFFMLEIATQNTDDVEGIEAVLSTHMARNSGVGARGELRSLPTAGRQVHKKSRIPLKSNYGTVKISGQLLRASASDRGSFARGLKVEVEGVVKDLKRDVNRQCYTPASGAIGIIVGAATTTSAVLTSAAQARRLEPGYRYDIVDGTTDALVQTVDLVSVVISTKTITFTLVADGPEAAADGDRIVNHGLIPSAEEEITGIESIIDASGEVFGINPSTWPRWASYEEAVSGLPTDTVFERAADEVSLATGEEIDVIVTSYEVARTFASTLKSQKRFNAEGDLFGGFKVLKVNTPRGSFALRSERDAETQEAYGLTSKALIHYFASDWEFMDEDGNMLDRTPGQDAYEAVLFKYHELSTDQRNAHFKLTGLTVV